MTTHGHDCICAECHEDRAVSEWFSRGDKMFEATPDTKKLVAQVPKAAVSQDPMTATSKTEALDPKAGVGAAKVGVQWVPPSAIIAIDEALAEGRIKYGTAKWRETRTEYMTYVGGALRHLYAFVDGEDIDPDSIVGKRHLAGALASLAILVDAIDCGTAVDNRPTKGGSPKRFATVKK